ncbi:MAG TPA: MFS transporter [Steroidobacteraceae bacterium]|nr:MFS transporter [Steroidobacteraceae bacterium]
MSSSAATPGKQALSHPDFARYAYGRFAATLAWQMIDVVLGYQVWELTHLKSSLGLIGLAQFLPFVVLLIPGGQIADRFDRRLIIALAYGLELVAATALLCFTLFERTEVLALFFIAALLGIGRAFWAPAGQAMVPNLVPRELLSGAISINTLMFTIATISGPAVAGLTLMIGIDWSYGLTVALLIVAITMMLGVRPVRAKSTSEWHWRDILGGFVFVWRKKPVLGAISLDLFAVLFGGVVALLPAYADEILHVGPIGLGLMRAAPGVGASIVAYWLSVRPIQRHAGTWMFGGVALFGICMIAVGLTNTLWIAIAVLVVAGAADMISVFVRGMLVQLETPDSIRGRVSAVNSMFIGASNELGAFRAGMQAQWFGIIPSMVWGGVCTLAVVGSYLGLFPQLRKLDQFPDPAK